MFQMKFIATCLFSLLLVYSTHGQSTTNQQDNTPHVTQLLEEVLHQQKQVSQQLMKLNQQQEELAKVQLEVSKQQKLHHKQQLDQQQQHDQHRHHQEKTQEDNQVQKAKFNITYTLTYNI